MYLAHIPVNHHLRPLYRALAALCGAYLLVFGVVGVAQTAGLDPFAQDGLPRILGQTVNPAQAFLDLVLGGVILVAVIIGRNWDHYVNFWIGQLLVIIGLAELCVLRTDANILGYSMTNVIVIFVIALVILAESLYGKVGSAEAVEAERAFAERAAPADHSPAH
jgi:glycerol uptake facilitator-like aquaporin